MFCSRRSMPARASAQAVVLGHSLSAFLPCSLPQASQFSDHTERLFRPKWALRQYCTPSKLLAPVEDGHPWVGAFLFMLAAQRAPVPSVCSIPYALRPLRCGALMASLRAAVAPTRILHALTLLPNPCCSTLAAALVVTDLGVVFQIVGGTCGAFFIFGAPGCLLIQYAYAKYVHARGEASSRLLERAAYGAAGRRAEALNGLDSYHFLTSKLFWSGVGLVVVGVGLCGVTVYTIINPM
jgi:hypothetical protein